MSFRVDHGKRHYKTMDQAEVYARRRFHAERKAGFWRVVEITFETGDVRPERVATIRDDSTGRVWTDMTPQGCLFL